MTRTIKLQRLAEERTIIEESKLFDESVFGFVYQKAKRLLDKIVSKKEANIEVIEKEQCVQDLQIDNIISFEGRRGTGKTSVMLSVCKALKRNYQTEFVRAESGEIPFFIVLDSVDASMLENGEDILDIILAHMFFELTKIDQQYGRERGSYENRELYKLFDEVYGSLKMNSKDYGRYGNSSSPLSLLTKVSNSQILKLKIFELTQMYLKYIGRLRYEGKKPFLVISVDDLDMHFQSKEGSPFELLETLHRYFMIPGVIILLTYSYADLCIGCHKHFYQIYHEWETRYTNNGKMEETVHNLTIQYLKKVLPIQTRIYMPSLKKRDYREENNIQIEMTSLEFKTVFGVNADKYVIGIAKRDKNEKIVLPLKKFVMLLKVSLADLYYDVVGNKKHFVEPTTIRELAQMYMFIKQLKNMYEETQKNVGSEEAETLLFKELLDEIYFRYAKVNLGPEEDEKFTKYLDVSIERRSKDILSDIRDKAERKEINISEITYTSSAEKSYSYGELLYCLYRAGRESILSKELVCCILDSYTVMLTKFYRKLKNGNQEYRKRILEVMGSSVSSSWSNLFIPKIDISNNKEKMDDVDSSNFIISVNSSLRKVGAKKIASEATKWEFELRENSGVIKQFQMLEVMLMFFTDVYYKDGNNRIMPGFKITYDNGKHWENAVKGSDKRPRGFTIEFYYGCFNIMNFVNNLFREKEYFDEIHRCLEEAFVQYFNDLGKRSSSNIQVEYNKGHINRFFEKNSLRKKYDKWFWETCGLAMPIYSFDMMYNVLKRVFQNYSMKSEFVQPDEVWNYVEVVYDRIGELLEKENEFYFPKINRKKDNSQFYYAYINSPFIDWLKKSDEKLEWKEQFAKMIAQIGSVPEKDNIRIRNAYYEI